MYGGLAQQCVLEKEEDDKVEARELPILKWKNKKQKRTTTRKNLPIRCLDEFSMSMNHQPPFCSG